MIDTNPLDFEEPVDCGDCSKCCRFVDEGVALTLEHDAINLLDTVYQNGGILLRQKADGSCVYLNDAGKCTIHGTIQPILCRLFDCRILAPISLAKACELMDCEYDPEWIAAIRAEGIKRIRRGNR